MTAMPWPLDGPLKCRTLWLSDIHLGLADCKADYLLELLSTVSCERLYLVGDIVDLWSMQRRVHWPKSHNRVLRTLLSMAHTGTEVIYIPGNHDEYLRAFCSNQFENVHIRQDSVHTTAGGRRLLVTHGDELDYVVRCSRFNALIGDAAYDLLLFLNRWTNRFRRRFGMPYWSLASWLKTRVRNAARAIDDFEHAAAHEARKLGYDGIVCGHLHHAAIREIDGVLYCNDGDWIESCTALMETEVGELQLLYWADRKHLIASTADDVAPDAVFQG